MREAGQKQGNSASLTARKVGRPSRSVSDRLDTSLLDLAADAFRASGYADVSLEGLAARIGVSKPTLYRRFANRNALLEAIVERQLALLEADGDGEASANDPLAGLRGYAHGLFLRFLQPDTTDFIRFLIQESQANPRLTQMRRQWHERVLERLRVLIAAAQARGALTDQAPDAIANLVVDLLYTPINLRLMGFDEARVLTGMTPDALFAWRFRVIENLA